MNHPNSAEARRRDALAVARSVCERHGFRPLAAPAATSEQAPPERLRARPAAVALARAAAQRELPAFARRYQIAPAHADGADAPEGAARIDLGATGTRSLLAEAEVCAAVSEVLHALGVRRFKIRLNHRQLLRSMMITAGIDLEHEAAALGAIARLDEIADGGVRDELLTRGVSNDCANRLMELILFPDADLIFGVSLSKDAGPKTTLARVRKSIDDPGGHVALDELEQLFTLLAATPAGPHVELSLDLIRDLDLCTGAIFEISARGVDGPLGGGGRHDDSLGVFTDAQIPAVGCSLDLEAALAVMQDAPLPRPDDGPEVLLCWADVPQPDVLATAHALRTQGLRVELFPEPAELAEQLRYAGAARAPLAVIVGASELAAGELTLHHVTSGERSRVAIAGAGAAARALLAR